MFDFAGLFLVAIQEAHVKVYRVCPCRQKILGMALKSIVRLIEKQNPQAWQGLKYMYSKVTSLTPPLSHVWIVYIDSACLLRIVFVNNFAFGPDVDHKLKERFASMKEGMF